MTVNVRTSPLVLSKNTQELGKQGSLERATACLQLFRFVLGVIGSARLSFQYEPRVVFQLSVKRLAFDRTFTVPDSGQSHKYMLTEHYSPALGGVQPKRRCNCALPFKKLWIL
jgi:hypothetical protein